MLARFLLLLYFIWAFLAWSLTFMAMGGNSWYVVPGLIFLGTEALVFIFTGEPVVAYLI